MIYGIPGINGLGNTKGVEFAPEKILEEGIIIELNNENISVQKKEIYDFVSGLEGKNGFIGGDHSISYSLVKAFFEKNKEGKLLIFDAHPDLMEPMKEPTHEEWLRGIVDDLGIVGKRIMIVGVRRSSENIDKREIEYAKEKEIKIIYSDEFSSRREEVIEFISEEKIYCSFDVDVFDSSIVNATGYPEQEGPNLELLDFLDEIKEKIHWFDLVEYNPLLDVNSESIEVVKKVLKKLDSR